MRALLVIVGLGGLGLLGAAADDPHAKALADLQASSATTRLQAADQLFQDGFRVADRPQLEAAMQRDAQLRSYLLSAYAGKPEAWMAPVMRSGLADPSMEIRNTCARGLGNLRDRAALHALGELLRKAFDAGGTLPLDARAAGAAIARIAPLKRVDFDERIESFPAGLMRVPQPEVWRESASKVLAWCTKMRAC